MHFFHVCHTALFNRIQSLNSIMRSQKITAEKGYIVAWKTDAKISSLVIPFFIMNPKE